MKVIIAGSRVLTSFTVDELDRLIKQSGFNITEVVCGDARGIDKLGERWAKSKNIPVKHFPANWQQLGKSAGYLRNSEMANYADAAIVITVGSKGSEMMIQIMKTLKKPVSVYRMNLSFKHSNED